VPENCTICVTCILLRNPSIQLQCVTNTVNIYFLQHCQCTTNCTKWLLVLACLLSHHQAYHFARTGGKNFASEKAMRPHSFYKNRLSCVLTI
jgi:hypothetical protein